MAIPGPWMAQFSRHINSAPGIENTLRLLQFTCTIVASLPTTPYPTSWARAGSQFALGRRYFRFFKFIEYFENAWTAYTWQKDTAARKRGFVASTLEFCKWSTLGIYLLLEDLTIFDALGVLKTTWGEKILLESNKFWLYALVFSFLGTLWQLYNLAPENGKAEMSGQPVKEADQRSSTSTSLKSTNKNDVTIASQTLLKDLVITGCDIFIPGYGVGWLPVSQLMMGIAAVVSTLLVGRDRWIKSQENTVG